MTHTLGDDVLHQSVVGNTGSAVLNHALDQGDFHLLLADNGGSVHLRPAVIETTTDKLQMFVNIYRLGE